MTSDYKAYFISKYPEEAAGYLKDGKFYELENLAEGDKRTECSVHPSFLLNDPDVFVHSHTTGWCIQPDDFDARSPSYQDLKSQAETGIEWAIATTDGETCSDLLYWGNPKNRPPLLGRDFIYNLQDCFALLQDHLYSELGVSIPTVPRNKFWHEEGQNLVQDHFRELGFTEVELNDLQPNDVLLYAVRDPVVRHIGIYLGNNQVLSHWYNRLSAIENYGTWAKYVKLAVRYTGQTK